MSKHADHGETTDDTVGALQGNPHTPALDTTVVISANIVIRPQGPPSRANDVEHHSAPDRRPRGYYPHQSEIREPILDGAAQIS